jgi:ParB family chromosome partitioning protein
MSDKTAQSTKTMPKKSGLGRGLGSLLGGSDEGAFSKAADPSATTAILGKALPSQSVAAIREGMQETPIVVVAPKVPDELRIWNISIEKLKPNPKQPRQVFDKEPLDELAASIREKGIIQPLLARKMPSGEFQIIAGERRWRAAQLADLKEVPVILKNTSEMETLELALIENIQRQDLNPIEEAEAYDFLMKNHGLTQQELAVKVGKERATVANVLRLLNLCPEVRLMVSVGEIGLGQAKVLLSIPDEETQIRLADKVKAENMSVRALEQLVNRIKTGGVTPAAAAETAAEIQLRHLQEEIQKIIGSKVVLDYNSGKGKISLHFHSDAELNGMVERIRDSWLN